MTSTRIPLTRPRPPLRRSPYRSSPTTPPRLLRPFPPARPHPARTPPARTGPATSPHFAAPRTFSGQSPAHLLRPGHVLPQPSSATTRGLPVSFPAAPAPPAGARALSRPPQAAIRGGTSPAPPDRSRRASPHHRITVNITRGVSAKP